MSYAIADNATDAELIAEGWELLESGHPLPAVMLARLALETALRNRLGKFGTREACRTVQDLTKALARSGHLNRAKRRDIDDAYAACCEFVHGAKTTGIDDARDALTNAERLRLVIASSTL